MAAGALLRADWYQDTQLRWFDHLNARTGSLQRGQDPSENSRYWATYDPAADPTCQACPALLATQGSSDKTSGQGLSGDGAPCACPQVTIAGRQGTQDNSEEPPGPLPDPAPAGQGAPFPGA